MLLLEYKLHYFSVVFYRFFSKYTNKVNTCLNNISQNATVQLVIATDGTDTYIMYIYGDRQMNWLKRSQFEKPKIFIGYSVEGFSHSLNPYSFTNLALEMDLYAETRGNFIFCLFS